MTGRQDRRPGATMPERSLADGISMWGAPASGKTTFLAALAVALEKHPEARWKLRGTDLRSSDALSDMENAVVDRGEFPGASTNVVNYNWELVNPDPRAGRRGPLGRPRRDRTVRVPLHVFDAPGEYHNPDTWADTDGAQELVQTMSSCAGFIFIYDPVHEYTHGDAYRHANSLLNRLDYRLGNAQGGFLPQSLAVCLAKFDDDRVFSSAKAMKIVDYDQAGDGSPYVDPDLDPERAWEFFERMCRVSPNPAAQELPGLLQLYFHPDKIKFFATSSIGFYVNPGTRRFDPRDPRNFIREPDKLPIIRGAMNPVNVAESALWLIEKLKGSRR